jgi:predicted DNA-binding transcriptional regulator AlpA
MIDAATTVSTIDRTADVAVLPFSSAYDILTPEAVAAWLHVSVKWLYDHTSRCKPTVPHVRLGGHLRFRRTAIENWLDLQESACA